MQFIARASEMIASSLYDEHEKPRLNRIIDIGPSATLGSAVKLVYRISEFSRSLGR
jgi:hypothetical protein